MQKKSNGSITFPVALGGMNNIAPQDNLQNNQAVLLQNITYDETTKSFKGSKKYNQVDIPNHSNFNKIYEVIHNDKRNILLVNENGFYDYNQKKFIETSGVISDVVYNDDGVYISYDNRVFIYANASTELKEIPFSDVLINTRLITQSASSGIGMLQVLGDTMYILYYTSGGVGYFSLSEETPTFKTLDTSVHLTSMQWCMLCKYNNKVYILKYGARSDSDKQVGVYELTKYGIGDVNNSPLGLLLLCLSLQTNTGQMTYPFSGVILKYKDGELYSVANFTYGSNANCDGISYNKYISDVSNYMLMGLHEFQTKEYDRLLRVKVSFLQKGWGGTGAPENFTLITLAIVYDALTGEELSSTQTQRQGIYQTYPFTLYTGAYKINSNNKIIAYAISSFYLLNIEKDFTCSFRGINILELENQNIITATQNLNKIYVSHTEPSTNIYEIDMNSVTKNKIPFMLINNGRLVVAQTNSLYYSGVGDFDNWNEETDADALFLEVGYKDSGNIIAGALTYGSIIIFKDNGYIYRVSGDYPNWSVVKIAETDNITSNIYNMGGTLLFGTKTGVKQINPTQVYGDFLLSDFQNNVITNEVTDISESQDRKTIIFCSKDYVIEYHTQLNIFYVCQAEVYSQMLEFYNNEEYKHYALKNGNLYEQGQYLNDVTVTRGLIHNEYNLVIKAITLYTDEIQKDTEIEIEFISGKKITRTLKKGQSKHKFFITVRLKEMQLKYIHSGDIFINNTIVEYSTVGA